MLENGDSPQLCEITRGYAIYPPVKNLMASRKEVEGKTLFV